MEGSFTKIHRVRLNPLILASQNNQNGPENDQGARNRGCQFSINFENKEVKQFRNMLFNKIIEDMSQMGSRPRYINEVQIL